MNPWMTLEQTAKYLQISRDSLYKKAQRGEIPASKIGNLWRFNKNKIDAWLEAKDRISSARFNEE